MKAIILFLMVLLISSCGIIKPLPERQVSAKIYAKRAAFTKKHGPPRNRLFDPAGGKPWIWR